MTSDDQAYEFRLPSPVFDQSKSVPSVVAAFLNQTLDLSLLQPAAKISLGKAKAMMESCVVCLAECRHSSGVTIKLYADNEVFQYTILWPENEIDTEALNRSYNSYDATEDGAEAIALMLSLARTGFTAVKRSCQPHGIDYWLGHIAGPGLPFQSLWRLEISGILRDSSSYTVNSRVNEKLRQTKQSDKERLPALVVVVEFSQPYAKMVSKYVNGR